MTSSWPQKHRASHVLHVPFSPDLCVSSSAVAGSKGLHSGEEVPLPRIVNASDNHSRAQQFLPSFKRAGRIPAMVEHVAAGSRFKILIPKDNQTLTLVLSGKSHLRHHHTHIFIPCASGIRAPKASRPGEKGEPYGNESLDFATRYQ